MVKIKVIESFATANQGFIKGREYTLPDDEANSFIRGILAELVYKINETKQNKDEKPVAIIVNNEEAKEETKGVTTSKGKRQYTPRKTKTARKIKTAK